MRRAATAAVLSLLLAGCAGRNGLKPFATDGCSLFPDRALIGSADWCGCCTQHDRTYWRGGTEQERAAADAMFHGCILKATGDKALADTMKAGVRAGGTPYLPTPWRWGYGWPADRGYAPLTPAERKQANRMLSRQGKVAACS